MIQFGARDIFGRSKKHRWNPSIVIYTLQRSCVWLFSLFGGFDMGVASLFLEGRSSIVEIPVLVKCSFIVLWSCVLVISIDECMISMREANGVKEEDIQKSDSKGCVYLFTKRLNWMYWALMCSASLMLAFIKKEINVLTIMFLRGPFISSMIWLTIECDVTNSFILFEVSCSSSRLNFNRYMVTSFILLKKLLKFFRQMFLLHSWELFKVFVVPMATTDSAQHFVWKYIHQLWYIYSWL